MRIICRRAARQRSVTLTVRLYSETFLSLENPRAGLNSELRPGIMGRLSSIEIYDVSKLDLHRTQNKQLDSDSDSRVQFQMQFSLARPVESRFIQPRALCFFFSSPRARTYI